MAINLKKLILNDGKREIKSIVYVDEKNNISVAYNDFGEIKDKYIENVTIYKPNKEQREWMLEEIKKATQTNDKGVEMEADMEFTYRLFKELTDFLPYEFDLNNKEDKEIWEFIMKNSNEFALMVNAEINQIANSLFRNMINEIMEFDKLPEIIKENVIAFTQQEQLKEEVSEKEKEYLKRKKELEELEKELKKDVL